MGRHSRACAPVAAVLLGWLMLGAAPAPAHNFVNSDLKWQTPEPLAPGHFRLAVDLLDTESVTRSGDTVEFDELDIQKTVTHLMSPQTAPGAGPPIVQFETNVQRYQASCGWRTLRRIPKTLAASEFSLASAFNSQQFTQDGFLGAKSPDRHLLDRICTNTPLNADRGAASAEAAAEFWKDQFGERDYDKLLIMAPKPKQSPVSWMDGNRRHRFVPVAAPSEAGNRLFVDTANTARRGDIVTALTLVFLGAGAQRFGDEQHAVVALRSERFDCAARTSSLLAQATWNRMGDFLEHSEDAFGTRNADNSPVVAAELAAACEGLPVETKAYASVEDAWAFAATGWPEPTQTVWVSCVWNRFPQDVRDGFLAQWRLHQPPAPVVLPPPQPWEVGTPPEVRAQMKHDWHGKIPDLPKVPDSVLSECVVPPASRALAWASFSAYAVQRGALDRLSSTHIDEAKIQAAWHEIPWLDRQRFIRSASILRPETVKTRNDIIKRITDRLGIDADDAVALDQVEHYLLSEARIESN